ncbi:nuclear protein 96-domain-containing protein, partial [Chiua virens]
MLQDNITVQWDPSVIAVVLAPYVVNNQITTILTFDAQGISYHPNHYSLPFGASHLVNTLRSRVSETPSVPVPRVFSLVTVPVLPKYVGPLAPLASRLSLVWERILSRFVPSDKNPRAIFTSGFKEYVTAVHAMRKHVSQLEWFRYLYVTFSRYIALISDGSDDEQTPYTPQDVRKQLPASPTKSVEMLVSSEEEEVDIEVDEDEEEEESEDSTDMDEDDIVVDKPTTRNHALVEDSDGEIHYEHTRGRSRSSSSSSELESDTERRRRTTVASWVGRAGMDPQKMHVMQTSLFRMPEEAAVLQALNQPARQRFKLSPTVSRKHSRDSVGDARFDSQERMSFAHDIDHPVYRPSRKYSRVDISSSAVAGNEGALADAGLALGHSFRIGWSSGIILLLRDRLLTPYGSRTSANSSIVTKARMPFFSGPVRDTNNRLSRLLQHHLSTTPIVKDEDGIPFADPSSELCFLSFTSLYPKNDNSYEASLFRLGHALFDEIDLRLGQDVTVDVRNRISAIRRKAALSEWLGDVVTSSVDADLKKQPPSDPAALIYTLLSGYQIEKACDTAMDCGFVKLATLVSQVSGDFEFREDVREQLQLWQEQRIDVHISASVKKIYSVLAGSLDVLEGSKASVLERCADVDPLEGLDWKRTFGMYLWYVEPMDAPIARVFESYDHAVRASPSRVAPPRPHYLEINPSQKHPFPHTISPRPPMRLFSLIRLHADPACTLSQILTPLSFGSSPADYSFPWHLYIILSRCMRIQMDEDVSGRREGHSPSADLLASYYAQQLEQLGMLQEAIFVLLHIEGSAGREKATRDLLHRSADKLDEWMCSGILGSLKIPLAWVNDAKALYGISQGRVFEAYKLYMAAGLYQSAHDLAIAELAPEAVIRQDLDLLVSLFEAMDGQPIDGWYIKGKARLERVVIDKHEGVLNSYGQRAVPMLVENARVEMMTKRIPTLLMRLRAIGLKQKYTGVSVRCMESESRRDQATSPKINEGTISAQPVVYDDDYQAPPHLSLKRVPVLSITVPPVPERKDPSSTPAAATINITFKSLKPPCTFTLAVQPTDTISDIKIHLASQPRAPPADAQRLLLKGKALADSKLLKEYDVKDGDTINLLVKPGFDWNPTKIAFPTSKPDMAPLDTESATKLTVGHRHTRTPSIVLSPSPSIASLKSERNSKPQDITLTLDTSTIPTASSLPSATRSSYQTIISDPVFWNRLLSFLRAEFSNENDALIAFEDFLRASKGGMTASEIAKIRDHVGVVGMAGT